MKKNKHIKKAFLIVVFSVFSSSLFAQYDVPTKEFGFRIVGLNSLDLVFKKERRPEKIIRYRLTSANISGNSLINKKSYLFNVGFAVGFERRKNLMNDTYFFQGWEPRLAFNLNVNDARTVGQIIPSIGYIIGFAHNFSDKFCMNLEIIPQISSIINTAKIAGVKNFNFEAKFKGSGIGVGIYYRIS